MVELKKVSLGRCQRCRLDVPATTIDGSRSREGIEYKSIPTVGSITPQPPELYHHKHPLYPDCWGAERQDPASPWNDRNFYDDRDDDWLEHSDEDLEA